MATVNFGNGKLAEIDFSELISYAYNGRLAEKDFNSFLRSYILKEGHKLVNITKELTPVDTGALKASWHLTTRKAPKPYTVFLESGRTGEEVEKTLFDYKDAGYTDVEGKGLNVQVTVENLQEYASNVEFGGPRNPTAHYMLTKGVEQIKTIMPQDYEVEFQKFKVKHGL